MSDYITDPIEEAIFLAHHPSQADDIEVQYTTYVGQPRRTCVRCQNAAACVRIALHLTPSEALQRAQED